MFQCLNLLVVWISCGLAVFWNLGFAGFGSFVWVGGIVLGFGCLGFGDWWFGITWVVLGWYSVCVVVVFPAVWLERFSGLL